MNPAYQFWKEKTPDIQNMFLNGDGVELDRLERAELLNYLPDVTGKSVLELASGIGRYTGHFAKHAKELVSVDFIKDFVDKNRRDHSHHFNVQFLCQNAVDADFEPGRFDLIFINWLFMYLTDAQVLALKEKIIKWLKPGGTLFFRESCAAKTFPPHPGDPATYRTLHFYTRLFNDKLQFIREGSMQVSIQMFANPFQCFWVFKKD